MSDYRVFGDIATMCSRYDSDGNVRRDFEEECDLFKDNGIGVCKHFFNGRMCRESIKEE